LSIAGMSVMRRRFSRTKTHYIPKPETNCRSLYRVGAGG
jgi:hypothetical protein